jgi:hypothetical protein
MDPVLAAGAQSLVLLGEATAFGDPCERALYHPPARDHLQALLPRLLTDDVDDPAAKLPCPPEQCAGIRSIGPDPLQGRRSAVKAPQQHAPGTASVLPLSAMHHAGEQQSVGIYEVVALTTCDLIARVVAVGVPLFPAVFTLCVSRTAAVGVFLRPCFTRVSSRSTS